MSDFTVKSGTTAKLGRIEGELKVGRNVTITAESGRKVVVTEGAYFEGPVNIDCDFECQSMRVEGRGYGPGGDVVVRGDLTVHSTADLNATVRVQGGVSCDDLDVGGHLETGALSSKRVRVGGHMKVRGTLESKVVDVGGHMTVLGAVNITDLRVGGHVEVGGGMIGGAIKVRGHFKTTKKLDYGHLEVFGNTVFPGGCSGESLTSMGRVEFEGDTACKELDIKGSAWVQGDCTSEKVEVNGKLGVRGSLTSEALVVLGSTDLKGQLTCETVHVSGKLVSDRVIASGLVEVVGEVLTAHGTKGKDIVVGPGSRISGPLVGGQVDVGKEFEIGGGVWAKVWPGALSTIGKMTRVDDVYGKVVKIWRYSSAKRVFAESVELGNDSYVDKITFTKELKLPSNYRLGEEATKTSKLPEPPL
jgi:cytoskeletal protein CcmA (bactofilin family)